MKIHSNFTVLKNVVWVKSPAYPVRIYVNLVRDFGWKQIFTDDTFNLVLRPLATPRLNIANLHVKTKGNQCWSANIRNIQDPSTRPYAPHSINGMKMILNAQHFIFDQIKKSVGEV